MRATAFFLLILALLAYGSGAPAATNHPRSAKDSRVALPWKKKATTAPTLKAPQPHVPEPDGLVVIEEKPYVPRQAVSPSWTIRQGETLTQALNNWAGKAGYSVVWNADHTFNIEASASFDGSFIKAVTNLFDAYKDADRAVVVDLYPDQKPKPVVVVSNKKAAQ